MHTVALLSFTITRCAVFHALLYFPLGEPALVECQSDVDAEAILRNEVSRLALHPLPADIKDGAIIPTVHDRDAETNACTYLLWAILPIDIIIRSGIRNPCTIAYAVEEMPVVLARTILQADCSLVAILVQT